MRRTVVALVVLVAAILVLAPVASAQQKPIEFRALLQQTLEFQWSTNMGGWTLDARPVHGLLNLQPVTPTIDMTTESSSFRGKMGQDLSKVYMTVTIEGRGSFTVGDWHATYEYVPGNAGLVMFRGVGRIISGTGAFEGATGMYTESGPTIMWPDPENADILHGQYQGAVTATIFVR